MSGDTNSLAKWCRIRKDNGGPKKNLLFHRFDKSLGGFTDTIFFPKAWCFIAKLDVLQPNGPFTVFTGPEALSYLAGNVVEFDAPITNAKDNSTWRILMTDADLLEKGRCFDVVNNWGAIFYRIYRDNVGIFNAYLPRSSEARLFPDKTKYPAGTSQNVSPPFLPTSSEFMRYTQTGLQDVQRRYYTNNTNTDKNVDRRTESLVYPYLINKAHWFFENFVYGHKDYRKWYVFHYEKNFTGSWPVNSIPDINIYLSVIDYIDPITGHRYYYVPIRTCFENGIYGNKVYGEFYAFTRNELYETGLFLIEGENEIPAETRPVIIGSKYHSISKRGVITFYANQLGNIYLPVNIDLTGCIIQEGMLRTDGIQQEAIGIDDLWEIPIEYAILRGANVVRASDVDLRYIIEISSNNPVFLDEARTKENITPYLGKYRYPPVGEVYTDPVNEEQSLDIQPIYQNKVLVNLTTSNRNDDGPVEKRGGSMIVPPFMLPMFNSGNIKSSKSLLYKKSLPEKKLDKPLIRK
jgi:hypothetical protein